MKQLTIFPVSIAISLAAYAKPQCPGFNNYNDKVTIVFTDEDAGKWLAHFDLRQQIISSALS